MPPLIILKGVIKQRRWWLKTNIPPDYEIECNETAYMNDALALSWVKFFEAWSAKRQKGVWRLLLLGGHTTHGIKDIIDFCDEYKILIFPFLPHRTHSMQPLDVVCFQQLKHFYSKTVAQAYSDGCTDFNKVEFLNKIHTIRMQAVGT